MDGDREAPCLKGQLLQARLEFLRSAAGYDGMERVLADLDEPDRRMLEAVEREAWYPFALLIRLDRAIARVIAPGDPDIYERLGAASARHRTEWLGVHARLINVHGFLSRVAEDHGRFHTFGHGRYRRTGFSDGELEYWGYPELDEIYCRSARGFLRSAVELLTGGQVRVEEPSCQCRGDPCCRFRIDWRRRA